MDPNDKQRENVEIVLNRIKESMKEDSDLVDFWSFELEKLLDDINASDFFGTEGQTDPRGDFRNGEWSMWNVEVPTTNRVFKNTDPEDPDDYVFVRAHSLDEAKERFDEYMKNDDVNAINSIWEEVSEAELEEDICINCNDIN